jgi:hypothetical protein
MMHLTCAVFNHDGSEILGSYNDEDIYLFDTKTDVYDKLVKFILSLFQTNYAQLSDQWDFFPI